jgi:hypothetical protein
MTTGERLVSISTLASGSAMEHFLNIDSSGGDITINVYDKYNVKYINSEAGLIKYIRPSIINIKYRNAPIFNINYMNEDNNRIKYIKQKVIKVKTYANNS